MKYLARCETVKNLIESLLFEMQYQTEGDATFAVVSDQRLAKAIEIYNQVAKRKDKRLSMIRAAIATQRAERLCGQATFDIRFDNVNDSNRKGWRCSYEYCEDYITTYLGSGKSYFKDYKGGTVTIVCNETDEEVNTYDIY